MSLNDAIAQGGNPFNPIQTLAQVNQLQSIGQERQLRDQQIRAAQMQNDQSDLEMRGQRAIMDAYQQSGGDLDKTYALAAQNGATPDQLIKLRTASIAQQKNALDLVKAKGEEALRQSDLMQGAADAIQKAPPEQKGAVYQQQLFQLGKNGVDVSQMPPTYPGDDQFNIMALGVQSHAKSLEQAVKLSEKNKNDAEANAAGFKPVGDVLYKLPGANGGQATVAGGQMMQVYGNDAKLLNVADGASVPVSYLEKAKQAAAAGRDITGVNGNQVVVDKTAPTPKVVATLGRANPMVVAAFNDQKQQVNPNDPTTQGVIDALGTGKIKLGDVLSPRAPIASKMQLVAAVQQKYPDWSSGDFDVDKKVREKFTSGNVSDQLMAINTAREHMKVFNQLADALDSGNTQALNRIGNAFGIQFGSDAATNFKIAAQAFGGEVGKALDGAGVTAGERAEAKDAFNPNMSPKQFKGAIATVDKLLAGKQKTARDTYQNTSNGKPNFGSDNSNMAAPQPGEPTAIGPNGHTIVFRNNVWMDPQTGKVQQ